MIKFPLLHDQRQRLLRDLRISVTDRCNFRCRYCMPKEVFDKNYVYLSQNSLLSFEEIKRLASIFVSQGVQKIRLTGGEPLLRKNLEYLIEMLSKLRTLEGKPLDIALTTNGSLLKQKAESLANSGLNRLTVSLDALDDAVFKRMNDVDFPVESVLEGIAAAQTAGFGRHAAIKINMVVKRGTNDDQILPMARHFKNTGIVLRFIEYMDVGSTNGWVMDEVLPSKDVIARIHAAMPLSPLSKNISGETAQRWSYQDGSGEIGVISSVTQAFCTDCTRARLSTEGKLYLCLFAEQGYDLKSLLRNGANDETLTQRIREIWQQRSDNYSQQRAHQPIHPSTAQSPMSLHAPSASVIPLKRVEMSYIGG